MRSWGREEGANLAMACFSQSCKTKFLFRLQFPLGASHLQRFPLIYRLVGRAKRAVFSTVWLASLWERGALHLSGFSAGCLSAFLPVSLTGQGTCPA